MAKKRKKRKNEGHIPGAAVPERVGHRRYEEMLQRGQEQLQEYYGRAESLDLDHLALDFERLMESEPNISLSKIAQKYGVTLQDLYAGITSSHDRTAVSYYSRPEIQQAIFDYAQDRKIAVVRNFHPLFQRLQKPEDISPLMLSISESYTTGRQWPSMHGTISRFNPDGNMWGWDLVTEIDYKRSWATSFDIARPLVKFFRELGIYFLVKFSGNTSPHIIIPAEAIPEGFHGFSAYRAFFGIVAKKVKQSSYLDRTFSKPSHFLRLPYSIHELTGKVSVPIRPEDYDSFSPKMAKTDSVQVLEGWWPVPSDAKERNQALVEYASGIRKQVAVGEGEKNKQTWEHVSLWDQTVKEFQKNPPPEGRIAPVADADTYNQIIQAGRDDLEHRDNLLKDDALRSALDELMNSEHTPSIKKIAREHKVDSEKLWFLWRWSLRQGAFDHYSQPEIQQAIHKYLENRKIWPSAGNELYMDLREPSHILPLAAYLHSNQGRKNWPGIQCTKGVYDPQTHDMTGADIVIDFDFRNGSYERAVGIMTPLLDILKSLEVTFSVYFGGNSSFHLAIPSSAIPGRISGKRVAFQHHIIARNLSTALRKIIDAPKGVYSWTIVPYQHTCVPYSVNEHTGLVCVPVNTDELDSFSPEMAQPPIAEVSVPPTIPENAPEATEAFLRKVMA